MSDVGGGSSYIDPPGEKDELASILIRYDGLDATNHEIEMSAFADSLKGISRILGVAGNFLATSRYVQHRDAFDTRIVVRAPQAHCYELLATLKWASENPLIATSVGGAFAALISYIFKRAAGQKEEMKQIRGALDVAIKELGTRDQSVVDRLLTTVDRMADALRPSARQAVAPIGETASTLSIGELGRPPTVRVGLPEKSAILSETSVEVGEERTYHIRLTELDMDSGSCRIAFDDDAEKRIPGRITDPAFAMANNSYVLAMAAHKPLVVRAKPTLRDGEIDRLFVSNIIA